MIKKIKEIFDADSLKELFALILLMTLSTAAVYFILNAPMLKIPEYGKQLVMIFHITFGTLIYLTSRSISKLALCYSYEILMITIAATLIVKS